ncbi:hypothetical protein VARIO8X_110099 [Burkholderiales bacterium 8X]|nr:hypothetical protein VARIO8X_110099 [Burkholderiales bacterium 8X]
MLRGLTVSLELSFLFAHPELSLALCSGAHALFGTRVMFLKVGHRYATLLQIEACPFRSCYRVGEPRNTRDFINFFRQHQWNKFASCVFVCVPQNFSKAVTTMKRVIRDADCRCGLLLALLGNPDHFRNAGDARRRSAIRIVCGWEGRLTRILIQSLAIEKLSARLIRGSCVQLPTGQVMKPAPWEDLQSGYLQSAAVMLKWGNDFTYRL